MTTTLSSSALSSLPIKKSVSPESADGMFSSFVQLSLALLLPGAPPTSLSGGSRASGIVAQETRDADKEYASSCYLPTDWTPLALLEKKEYNHDSTLYDFELPAGTSLNLPACACILLLAPGADKDGADAIRPYTPISANEVTGRTLTLTFTFTLTLTVTVTVTPTPTLTR